MLTAKLGSLADEEAIQLLDDRQSLMCKFKEVVKKFAKDIECPKFINHKNFIRRVEAAFKLRDQFAHGIYLLDSRGQWVLYHPRTGNSIVLDVIHLKAVSKKLDNLSADTAPMAKVIDDRKAERDLG